MTSPDKPDEEDSQAGTGNEPETVDAEIVDETEEAAADSSATPEPEPEPSADEPAKKSTGTGFKGTGGLSVGLILLVVLVLTLGFALISHFWSGPDDEAPVAGLDSAPPAITAEIEGAPDEETIDEAAEEAGDPAPAIVAESPAATAQKPAETAQSKTANDADSMKSAAGAQSSEDEPTMEELAAQRREAAAERARLRREQAQAEADDAAPEIVSAEETGTADEAAPETAADDTQPSASDDSDRAATGNLVSAELLTEQRRANARQAEEIAELRQELDQAIAEQDRKSEERIAELEERIAKIQSQDIAAATKQAAMALAVSNLQRQMYSGRPFADQLAVLEKLTGPSQSVRSLKEYADEGLPPMTYLQYQFLEASRQSLAAARREEASGPLGEFWANFTGLFTVRKKGARSGDNPSAIISRAEASLDDGDIEAALRELSMLEGEPAEAFEAWMEEARARLAADQLLDDVTNRVLAQAG